LTTFETQEEANKIEIRRKEDGFWERDRDRISKQTSIAKGNFEEKIANQLNSQKEEPSLDNSNKFTELVKKHEDAKKRTQDALKKNN